MAARGGGRNRGLFSFFPRDLWESGIYFDLRNVTSTKEGSSRIMEDAISIRAHLFNDVVRFQKW